MPEKLLLAQFHTYPKMQPQDAVKLLYQAAFGAGHAVKNAAACKAALHAEYMALPKHAAPCAGLEEIGNGMCRAHLALLQENAFSEELFADVFIRCANTPPPNDAADVFSSMLSALQALCAKGAAPFTYEACSAYLQAYRREGCPPVSHSAPYKSAYRPAYRVLPLGWAALLPLLQDALLRLQRLPAVVFCMDGRCGAGKTTTARAIQAFFSEKGIPCSTIHMDDFFLPPAIRTEARLREPGGNIHYERFYSQVSESLAAGKPAVYQRYDCASMAYTQTKRAAYEGVVLIEGAYALHPKCAIPGSMRVFLTLDEQMQAARLLLREGPEGLARFRAQWIPLEEAYLRAYGIPATSEYLLNTTHWRPLV